MMLINERLEFSNLLTGNTDKMYKRILSVFPVSKLLTGNTDKMYKRIYVWLKCIQSVGRLGPPGIDSGY